MGKKIKLKDLVQEGRSIQEKFNKKINEAPFGNAPGGMMSPDGQYQYANFNELVKDYAQTRYDVEMGESESRPLIQPLEQLIIKMKGGPYFELVSELVSLQMYAAEYAGPSESKEVRKSIIRISKKLGIPPDATSV